MKNVIWLLMNTQKWAEPLGRSSEDSNTRRPREERDYR
jgi:hypothetical protein